MLYELLVASLYYAFIAASIAEVCYAISTTPVPTGVLSTDQKCLKMSSSIPTAGGVYHWASITPGPRLSRPLGFFAGWLNYFGWIFDLASIVYIMSELVVQMYAIYHPSYVIQPWHIFVALVCICWLCIAVTVFLNRYLPYLQHFGLFMVLVGGIVTIIVVAAMPKQHATSSSVWLDYNNTTGWGGGVAFLTGVLNGAFTIGTTDAVTHMSEELPNPKKDLPRIIAAQLGLGCLSTCLYCCHLWSTTDSMLLQLRFSSALLFSMASTTLTLW